MIDYKKEFETYLVETKNVSDNTLQSYLRDLNQFLAHLKSKSVVDVTLVTSDMIQKFMDALSALGRSHATVTRALATVRCYYQFLVFTRALQR